MRRLLRRRRPAGLAQVPPPASRQLTPSLHPRTVLLGLGPGRTLRDARSTGLGTVAHVWYDTTPHRRLVRVEWPIDLSTRAPVAPLDLSVGHVLEFRSGPCTPNARPVYAAVVRVAAHEVVLIDCEDVDTAVCVAAHVVELWRSRWFPERVTSTLDANQ